MSEEGETIRPEGWMDLLRAGDIEGLDAVLRERMRGPEGTHIRQAHLLETAANKLFAGDFEKAMRLLNVPTAGLEGKSINEAAESHTGMVSAIDLIEKLVACGFGDEELVLGEAAHSLRSGETTLLLELLPAAWDMDDHEFELLLQAPAGWLRAWRNHEVAPGPEIRVRVRRLRQFHGALASVGRGSGYAKAWRRRWAPTSPIGQRSIWEAYQADGDAVLELVTAYILGAA